MPTLEDVLAEKTYKQDGLDVGQRVMYTLIGDPNTPGREALQTRRNSKIIALLIKTLYEKHIITIARLDEILLDVVS